jgi:hypothetical protein
MLDPEARSLLRVRLDEPIDVLWPDRPRERLFVGDKSEFDGGELTMGRILEKLFELEEAVARRCGEIDELQRDKRGRRVAENRGHRILLRHAEDAELLVTREERVEPHVVVAARVALLTAEVGCRDVRLDAKFFELRERGEDLDRFLRLKEGTKETGTRRERRRRGGKVSGKMGRKGQRKKGG